jgi:hypothetical protein
MGHLIRDESHMTTEREDNDSADSMLLRLQQQLDEIDTREMMRGSTDADLKEKGFIGDKRISVDRAAIEQGTDPEHLFFQTGVEYERIAGSAPYAEITIDKLLHLDDVAATELIAYRAAGERVPFDAGENVRLEIDGPQERYFALRKGKVAIVGNRLHVVPSDVDCTVSVAIAPDKMSALADCTPGHGAGTPLTVAGIKSALGSAGAHHGHLDDAIAALVDKANGSLTRQTEVIVAAGTPPRPGRPGAVKYTFDTSEQEYDFKILADGRIDYRNTRNIVMAAAGDILATLADPLPGFPGVDVLGHTVPAEDGSAASLLAGVGARVSEDGRQIVAEISGSIVLNGSIIEVVDTFVVNGDVDYSTGNIDFRGNVFISGNVVEGFGVKADGDIVVVKNVESSRVEAGRDVVVKGGVQGKGKGLVAAGRDVRVGFAQNARLEAQGNIAIANFAVNSYIFTSRQLTMATNRGGGYRRRGVCATRRGGSIHRLGERGQDVRGGGLGFSHHEEDRRDRRRDCIHPDQPPQDRRYPQGHCCCVQEESAACRTSVSCQAGICKARRTRQTRAHHGGQADRPAGTIPREGCLLSEGERTMPPGCAD